MTSGSTVDGGGLSSFSPLTESTSNASVKHLTSGLGSASGVERGYLKEERKRKLIHCLPYITPVLLYKPFLTVQRRDQDTESNPLHCASIKTQFKSQYQCLIEIVSASGNLNNVNHLPNQNITKY